MKPEEMYEAYEDVSDALEASWEEQDSAAFTEALGILRHLAETGVVEAISALAEILALPGPHRDQAAAYRWYFIAYSAEDYRTEFIEQPGPHYVGPVGDFRNEAPVVGLVDELGFDRIRRLDEEACGWLGTHKIFFSDPRDHRTAKRP